MKYRKREGIDIVRKHSLGDFISKNSTLVFHQVRTTKHKARFLSAGLKSLRKSLQQTCYLTGDCSADLRLGTRSRALCPAIGRWGIGAATRA